MRLSVTEYANGYEFMENGSFYIGQKVRTIHDAYAEIAGIYDGKYPYVVRKFRNGKTYLSDYSANQLVAL